MTLACLRLDPNALRGAVASLVSADPTWQNNTDGFEILNEEPELYNKWLYSIPDTDGSHRLLGLSRRFCPITNHSYAGFSLYHPGLPKQPRKLLGALRTVVRDFLPLSRTETRTQGILRGLIAGLDQSQRAQFEEWSSEVPLDCKCLDDAMLGSAVDEERDRVSWRGKASPVWEGDSGVTVEVGGKPTMDTVFSMQSRLNLQLRDKLNRLQFLKADDMKRGISAVAERHERHGFLTIFSRGAFLVSRRSDVVTGCVWCFRSFHPRWSGWTIWLRRPFVHEDYRGQGMLRALARAAIGMFAEAGHPTRLRRLCNKEAPDGPLLGKPVTSTVGEIIYPELDYRT